MYAYLRGKLAVKNPTSVILDLAGVGYEVSIPLSTFDHLPEVGGEVFLYIYPCYRPENVTLCGFATKEEKLLIHGLNGKVVVDASLAELRRSWKKTFSTEVEP